MVVAFAVMSGVVGFAGVLALDVGFKLAERRDAQGDADAIALAGALELPRDDLSNVDAAALAVAQAEAWAIANGVDPATELSLTVLWNNDDSSSDECFAGQGPSQDVYVGVRATVTRTAPSIFLRLLTNVGDIDELTEVTTTATACSGRPTEMTGFMPIAVSQSGACFQDVGGDREPIPGERCDLTVDASASGLIGQLGLPTNGDCDEGNPSANVFEQNLINGVEVFCSSEGGVTEVQGNPGFNVGKAKSGIEARLATEGSCETNYPGTLALFNAGNAALDALYTDLDSPSRADGMDDFFEVFQYNSDPASPAATLAQWDCDPALEGVQTSPRNVAVIVVADYATPDGGCGPKCYTVQGFGRMYIEGCTNGGTFYKDCDWNGGGSFVIHARFVASFGDSKYTLGHSDYGDLQTFLKE
jgi:hypothetical protein